MSRSGYTDDVEDTWRHIMWRGAVASALRGKRGQQALREIAAALDEMPEKALAADSLVTADGDYCTLGALGRVRGMDIDALDPDDWQAVAKAFGIAPALVREIVFENDEAIDDYKWIDIVICGPMRPHSPYWERHNRTRSVPRERAAEERWQHMRAWVASHIKTKEPA
jgi:hypothetical protein